MGRRRAKHATHTPRAEAADASREKDQDTIRTVNRILDSSPVRPAATTLQNPYLASLTPGEIVHAPASQVDVVQLRKVAAVRGLGSNKVGPPPPETHMTTSPPRRRQPTHPTETTAPSQADVPSC